MDSKVDRMIFFHYYDGFNTDGMVGFDINAGPPGSTKHWRGGILETAMTSDQFRSKGKTLAVLARAFLDEKVTPPQELRPQFVLEEINKIRNENENKDTRSPAEKLSVVTDNFELFIFFKYYDGYKTGGAIGFSLNAGPPGTVNHKRAYMRILGRISDSRFRFRGRILAKLAKEFVDCGIVPPEDLRPVCREREPPSGMLEEASKNGH